MLLHTTDTRHKNVSDFPPGDITVQTKQFKTKLLRLDHLVSIYFVMAALKTPLSLSLQLKIQF